MEFHGLYDYLGSLSLAEILMLCVAMYLLAVAILYPMRWLFEGHAYNVARSSNFGDLALTLIIFGAWSLMHDRGIGPPAWAAGFGWVIGCAIASTIVALWFTFEQTVLYRTHVTDLYHNSVVMGFMTFALLYVAPLILWSGDYQVTYFSFLCLVIWIYLVISDTKSGRMQQREWLAENRPDLKFKY